jgi:hypothetical protein
MISLFTLLGDELVQAFFSEGVLLRVVTRRSLWSDFERAQPMDPNVDSMISNIHYMSTSYFYNG